MFISNLALVFENFKPSPQIWTFWIKKHQLSNFNKNLPVLYFEGANFKSDICFQNFKLKSQNLSILDKNEILMKFWLYAILKVLISNLRFVFFGFQPVPRLHESMQYLWLATYLGKVSKYYDLNCYFLKLLIANMAFKNLSIF